MEGLPNEILRTVIGFLDKDDLLIVRLLNKTCQIYVEEYLKTMSFTLKSDKDIADLIEVTSWRILDLKNTLSTPFIRLNLKPEHHHKDILNEFFNVYGNAIRCIKFKDKKKYRNLYQGDKEPLDKMLGILLNTPNIEEMYFMNQLYYPSLKTEYELCLPKLRILQLDQMNMDFVKLIVNAATNAKEVKLKIAQNAKEKWEDCVNILEAIATRKIETKLEIYISNPSIFGITLENFKYISQIPIKIKELTFSSRLDKEELIPIQDFIQKHSKNLKYLYIECSSNNKDELLTFNLKNMENLGKLELSGRFEVNIEHSPLLQEVRIEDSKLNFISVPSLKSFTIESDAVGEYLDKLQIQLFQENIQLEKLCLICSDEQSQLLNNLIVSQAKHLRELSIETGMGNLHFPKLENLEFLNLNSYIYTKSSGECMQSVHTLIIDWKYCNDFEISGLHYPILRKLHLKNMNLRVGKKFLPFIFKNMGHIEALYIENGFTWREFIGYKSELVDSGISNANILNTSEPNLGDMNVLWSLRLGRCIDLDDFKAIPYLISCGKLSNLKYFEATVPNTDKDLISPFIKIIESNNTKTKIHYKNYLIIF